VLRVACVAAIAFAISACSQSDGVTNLNGPVTDASPRSAVTGYTRLDLGTLGGSSSYAAAINSSGVVVGWSETKAGDTHAFRWTPAAGMVDLGTLPGQQSSQAVAILDGNVATDSQILGMSGRDAVVWSASGSISVLPVPLTSSASSTFPQGFNDRGEVVGFDAGGDLDQRAWIWSAHDGKSDLTSAGQVMSNEGSASAITPDGVALLTARAPTCTRNPQCWRTYLWSKNSGFQPLGVPDNNSEASVTGLAINEAGTVVGWTDGSGGVAPYRWTAATGFTVLPDYPSATYAYATGVNPSGNTVGAALDPTSGSIVATLWPASGGIQRLTPENPNPSVALAINSGGSIVGWASVSAGVNHAMIWVPSSQLARWQAREAPSPSSLGSPSVSNAELLSATDDGCLKQMHSLGSRHALFACAMQADRARRTGSR
jgi:probable HAF family extracellular repeat protein